MFVQLKNVVFDNVYLFWALMKILYQRGGILIVMLCIPDHFLFNRLRLNPNIPLNFVIQDENKLTCHEPSPITTGFLSC